MADTQKLIRVVAMLCERDEDFKPFERAAVSVDADRQLWSLSSLKKLLGYTDTESIDKAVNRAKITASKVGWSIKEHFVDGATLFTPGEVYLTKYAALLVTLNADVNKLPVAIAQAYFTLQIDQQRLEDEKRLRTRLDVATENRNMCGAAKDVGVMNFEKFNGLGISALYGGRSVAQLLAMKCLPPKSQLLDYAGSEELAANLFRITQTAAALRRQVMQSENQACFTHQKVARGVRTAILAAGNIPPERLPAAKTKIDQVSTKIGRRILPTVGDC
jgi:DNA-damage-inducible protein D